MSQPMPTIPADQAAQTQLILNTLADVVNKFGEDHIYGALPAERFVTYPGLPKPQCQYVHNDGEVLKPACIAAHVLYRLGISLEQLERCEGKGVHVLTGWGLTDFQPDLRGLTQDSLHVLRTAQTVQDNGGTWGEALKRARDYAANSTTRLSFMADAA
jgi:hypothetical protein